MVVKMQDTLASIGVKKALPFTKFLNYELNKLRGSGVLKNVFTISKENCPLNENPMPITFHKMYFLFTLFVLGGLLSIIIFIVEKAVSSKKDGTLEQIDCRAIVSGGPKMAMSPSNFGEIEKTTDADTETKIYNLLIVPQELRSNLRYWMESNATQPNEEFLKLMKLEVGAIGQSVARGKKEKQEDPLKKDEKNIHPKT